MSNLYEPLSSIKYHPVYSGDADAKLMPTGRKELEKRQSINLFSPTTSPLPKRTL